MKTLGIVALAALLFTGCAEVKDQVCHDKLTAAQKEAQQFRDFCAKGNNKADVAECASVSN